jgi:hypothetical protein
MSPGSVTSSVRTFEAKVLPLRNSRRSVLWNRSTLPVVVGDRGAVSRCLMPFSRHIRSNSTSAVPLPNRPVNTLPLSVRIWSGTPWVRSANPSASQVGRAVALATTNAETQNLEWSSTPVMTFASEPSMSRTPPTASICTAPSPGTAPSACSQPASVVEPLSPRYRSRVSEVSPGYRSHGVQHEPEPHTGEVEGH